MMLGSRCRVGYFLNQHLSQFLHETSCGELGTFLGLLEFLLGLAVLGEVESGDLLGFLDLFLVNLDLGLQLVGELGHLVLVLLILFSLERKFLDFALSALVCLVCLGGASLGVGEFHFKLSDLVLHLGHGSFSSLHGSSLCISQAILEVGQLRRESVLGASVGVAMVLLSTELVSEAGSIHHGTLRLLLGILGSLEHAIDFSLGGVDHSLHSSLAGQFSGVDDTHFAGSSTGIVGFDSKLSSRTIGTVEKSLALLNFSTESCGFALRDSNLLGDCSMGASCVFVGLDGLTKLTLVTFDGLQSLSIGLVGMIQSNLKLIDISFHFLLDTESLGLSLLFYIKRSGQRLHRTGMIFPGVVKLLLLLSHAAINLLSHLSRFQLSSKYFVFLLLKSTFGLLQSGLKLFLLNFESPALFVKLVDRSATVTELIQKILDFIRKILVFSLDNIKHFRSFILSSLETEVFRAVVSSLVLRRLDFSCDISCLGLPFAKNLVKVLGTLLSDHSRSMNAFILHRDFIKVGCEPSL